MYLQLLVKITNDTLYIFAMKMIVEFVLADGKKWQMSKKMELMARVVMLYH